MAIIVRTTVEEKGQEKKVKMYVPGATTKEERELADELDEVIEKKMREIESIAKGKGLLPSKKKKILELRYLIGSELNKFLEDGKTKEKFGSDANPNNRFFWAAIYDHCGKLAPTKDSVATRSKELQRNFFFVCYKLVKSWDWSDIKAYTWDGCREILEDTVFKKDRKGRIFDWIVMKSKTDKEFKIDRKFVRSFSSYLKKSMKKLETRVLSDADLEKRLENTWQTYLRENSATKS